MADRNAQVMDASSSGHSRDPMVGPNVCSEHRFLPSAVHLAAPRAAAAKLELNDP